jgi:hypothetical protein
MQVAQKQMRFSEPHLKLCVGVAMDPENSSHPTARAEKPRVSIFDPNCDDRHSDEVLLARMRGLENPAMYLPPFAITELIIAIVKAKLDAVMAIWRGKQSGTEFEAKEHLADAACWVLEVAELDGHSAEEVAMALETAARARIDHVSKFSHKRGPKPKPKAENALPKRRKPKVQDS